MPLPLTAIDRDRDGLRRVDVDVERLRQLTAGDRLVVQLRDRGRDLGRGDVLGLDHDGGRHAAARERLVEAVQRLDDRLAAGHALGAGLLELHAERGDRQRDEQAAGEHHRDDRVLDDAVEDRVPHAGLAAVLVATLAEVGDAALLEPVLLAEVGEHRGEERQRPEHGDGDHEDRAEAERGEDRVAGEEHAGHRRHDGEPGDQHRATRGRGSDVQRIGGRAALVLLLGHPAHVEHRVVDAHGKADEHGHLRDGGVQRHELADRAEQAGGRHERADAQQQRHAGRDGGAEREQQDDQRPAHGDVAGLRLVGALLGTECVLLRRGAVLLHEQLGMRLLDRGDRGQRSGGELLERLHVLAGLDLGGQRERHQHGATVLGDRVRAVLRVERALDLGDAFERAEAADHILHGGGHLRRIGLDRALALDEHALADGVGEAGVVDDHRALLGLTVAGLGRAEVLLADVATDHGGEHDEEDPSEDGGLAVRGTPSACPRCEVSRLHAWSVPAPTSPSQGVARRPWKGPPGAVVER